MSSTFIWYELLTSDPDAAGAFFGAVLGWTVTNSQQPGMDYRIFNVGDVPVGGLMALPPGAGESGMQPGWLGYINVADVDASVASIRAAGGAEHMPAMDVPNVGRMAMVADPQGAIFYVMTPISQEPSTAFAARTPGHGGWNELHTTDWRAALSFYAAQFGWATESEMDMGPMGTYLLFNAGSSPAIGGMLNSSEAPRPHWLYYFNVAEIESAAKRVSDSSGTVLMQPHQVPTGEWIVLARDPQGAMFALVGPKSGS
jgi:predicted enzyme related to lactoylglutathione lyase